MNIKRDSKPYTASQIEYINSVELKPAHKSALIIIGRIDSRIAKLEAQLAAAQEREKIMIGAIRKAQSILMSAESGFLPATILADEHRELVAELREIQTKWRELPEPPREAPCD